MNYLKKIYHNDQFIFLVSVLTSMLIYYPMRLSGVTRDYLGWLTKYETGSYSDVLNCFGYEGLHQVFHLLNFTIYKVVGVDPFGQYMFFSITHGIVVFVFFKLVKLLTETHQVKNAMSISLISVFIFLVSPYQIEVITWKACFHYLMSASLIYGSYVSLIKYAEFSKRSSLVWHHVLFLLALFTLEISLAAPFIFIAYTIFYTSDKSKNKKFWIALFIRTGLVQIGFIILYFLLNKLVLGVFIGHYGASRHLDIKSESLFGTGFKYLFKRIFYVHYLPYDIKNFIYETLGKPIFYYPITIVFSSLFIWFVSGFNRWSQKVKLAGLSFVQFFMGIFPIVTLYFMYIFWYENDRYGYLASGFLYFALVLLLFQLGKKWRYSLLSIFVGLSIFLFVKTSQRVSEGAEIYYSLLEDFRWYDSEEVVILSIPYNYHGYYMYVDYTDVAAEFQEALYFHLGKKLTHPLYGISQFNMMNPNDKIGVNAISDSKLQVMIGQGGTWFWRKGMGLTNYENDKFKVSLDGWFFMLDLKNPSPGTVYIYPEGGKWKEVDFSKE